MNPYALVFLLTIGVVIWLPSAWMLEKRWPRATASTLDLEHASSERGAHLAEAVAICAHCHGQDLGGAEVVDMAVFGRLWAPNLTRPSASTDFGTWQAAIRDGIDAKGRTLIAMPSDQLGALSAEDLADIWSYLEGVPQVERDVPSRWIGPLPRLLFLAGQGTEVLSATHAAARRHPPAPPAGPTAEYGEHLARVGLCHLCHHENLAGGLHPLALPDEPSPADLRPEGPLEEWSRTDFGRAMRAGLTPDGRQLDSEYMPWPRYAALTDLELDALWAYLQVGPRAAEARGLDTQHAADSR